MSFKNKVVLITGASSGIGAATAIKFAQEGAKVAIVGRNQDKLRNVLEKCAVKGSKPLVIVADLSKEKDLVRIYSNTIEHFGKLDVLVNNAAILHLGSILTENTMEAFDKVVATNLRSAVYLTHLAASHLIKTKGNIVNISSISSKRIFFDNAFIYDITKAGLDQFTKSVALELAPKGVRVNSVNPGLVRTDIVQTLGVDKSMQEVFWDSWTNSAPLGKHSTAEEIAELILFIASDKGNSMTGSTVVADNGMLLVSAIGNIQSK